MSKLSIFSNRSRRSSIRDTKRLIAHLIGPLSLEKMRSVSFRVCTFQYSLDPGTVSSPSGYLVKAVDSFILFY